MAEIHVQTKKKTTSAWIWVVVIVLLILGAIVFILAKGKKTAQSSTMNKSSTYVQYTNTLPHL